MVATRLSEDRDIQVALLEAGPDDDEFVEKDTPLLATLTQKTDLDWMYETVPQEHSCFGLKGNVSLFCRLLHGRHRQQDDESSTVIII